MNLSRREWLCSPSGSGPTEGCLFWLMGTLPIDTHSLPTSTRVFIAIPSASNQTSHTDPSKLSQTKRSDSHQAHGLNLSGSASTRVMGRGGSPSVAHGEGPHPPWGGSPSTEQENSIQQARERREEDRFKEDTPSNEGDNTVPSSDPTSHAIRGRVFTTSRTFAPTRPRQSQFRVFRHQPESVRFGASRHPLHIIRRRECSTHSS